MDTPKQKTCTGCHITKDLSEFSRNKKAKDGKRQQCRTCANRKNKIYRAIYPEKNHEYYLANREKIIASIALYQAAHPEQVSSYKIKWAAAHPEVHRAKEKRRRAAKANAPVNDLTHAQWLEIQASQDHRCYYCGKRRKGKLTQDHILALSEGGSHTLHNVIAACHSCNSKKGARAAPIPVQPLLLTLASPKPRKGL